MEETKAGLNRKFTFKKEERLCGKKAIDELFDKGKSFKAYPFLVYYIETEGDNSKYPAQVLTVARKKGYKRAVARNLIKRRIREAYRLNKHELYDKLIGSGKQLRIALIYIAGDIKTSAEFEAGIKAVFQKINEKLFTH